MSTQWSTACKTETYLDVYICTFFTTCSGLSCHCFRLESRVKVEYTIEYRLQNRNFVLQILVVLSLILYGNWFISLCTFDNILRTYIYKLKTLLISKWFTYLYYAFEKLLGTAALLCTTFRIKTYAVKIQKKSVQ